MKSIRKSVVLASLAGAVVLTLAVPAAMSAVPGMGWDAFRSGDGEPIPESSAYLGTSMDPAPTLGFDVFYSGDGVRVEDFQKAYMGTSLGSEASDGWDVFGIGEGDPLP
jgi:hypothetical protein